MASSFITDSNRNDLYSSDLNRFKWIKELALTWENRYCKGENNGNNNNDAAMEGAAAIMAQ